MKKTFVSYIFITAVILIFASCDSYRYIYSASPANNPYFTEKGQSKLTGYYSSAGEDRLANDYAHGLDLQAAYALDKHWALTANYFERREKDIFSNGYDLFNSSTIKYKRHLFDFGGGYFSTLDPGKEVTFNLYAGLGGGKFSFNDNGLDKDLLTYNRYHESKITKWFIQPSLNYMPYQYLHLSFAAKISFMHYGNIRTSYKQEELEYFSLNRIANRTLTYFEPCFNVQAGFAKFPWILIDLAISATSGYRAERYRLRVRGANTSIGLNFDFSKMKKNKSNSPAQK